MALAALLTGLLAAPVLLLVLEIVPESERYAHVTATGGKFRELAWRPATLRVLVEPLAFGSPRDGSWSARPMSFNELCSAWAGLLPLAAAVAAAAAGKRLWLLAGGAFAAAVAFGVPPALALFRAARRCAWPPRSEPRGQAAASAGRTIFATTRPAKAKPTTWSTSCARA
jgi:hypothetical protein